MARLRPRQHRIQHRRHREMGAQAGFTVDASEDPSVLPTENLKQDHALVFSNTNNRAFNNQSQTIGPSATRSLRTNCRKLHALA
jgi:hypothetical protein